MKTAMARTSQRPGRADSAPQLKSMTLDQKTVKALETLAFFYSKFEKAAKTLGEVDELFDKDSVMMQEAMIRASPAFCENRAGTSLRSSGKLLRDALITG